MQILTNVTFKNVPILIHPLDLSLYHIHSSCVFLKKGTTVIHPQTHLSLPILAIMQDVSSPKKQTETAGD